jgi:hypothetical protein
MECVSEFRAHLLETMSRVRGPNRLEQSSGIATSYSEARNRVLNVSERVSLRAVRVDRRLVFVK